MHKLLRHVVTCCRVLFCTVVSRVLDLTGSVMWLVLESRFMAKTLVKASGSLAKILVEITMIGRRVSRAFKNWCLVFHLVGLAQR